MTVLQSWILRRVLQGFRPSTGAAQADAFGRKKLVGLAGALLCLPSSCMHFLSNLPQLLIFHFPLSNQWPCGLFKAGCGHGWCAHHKEPAWYSSFFLATGGLVVGAGRATNHMGNLVCVGCTSRSIPFPWSNVNMLLSINLDLKEVSLPPST